ncbi:hypothetical protein DPMN_045623 [Dreissena polymorpha]|uniref:Uncharacterized protein n=2 Tax=Dreissena polymorpha TaxID=45954 RepID=A0A9D4D6P1_DREPO|nr:hypothetical protein DPMN_045623 [Dreissena polymorpha]
MEKTKQLQACNKFIEHMEAKNAYMRTNYGGVNVEECLARAADFNIKKCQSNCIKCRKMDFELTSKRIAVRNILNEYNALHKRAVLRGLSEESSECTPIRDCKKEMQISEHIDNYWRTRMQRIFRL